MKKEKKQKIHQAYYIMLLPMGILFFFFHTFPFLQGIFYSLTDWKGYGNWNLVGIKNYLLVIKDPNIIHAYLFTFLFALDATVIVNIISLFLASALNTNIYFKNFLKAVFFLPYILGTLIVSYVFRFVFSDILPHIAQIMGWNTLKYNILGTSWAWVGVLFVTIWQSCAFNTIIYMAGLQGIDTSIYEAANLDGAGSLRKFIQITFPLLSPFFTINMVLCGKNFLMAFDQIIGLTGGGPGNLTTTISVLIYKRGFQGGQFAYQSANAVLLFLIVAAISVFQLKVLENRERKYI